VVDQSQTSFGGIGGGYTIASPEQLVAQTFTPATSGTICRVSLHLAVRPGHDCDFAPTMPGDLVVEIRSTTWDTALVFGGNYGQTETFLPTDVVLASERVGVAQVSQDVAWIDVPFTSPITLAAGERYAIVLGSEDVPFDDGCEWWTPFPAAYAWTGARGPSGTDLYPAGQKLAINAGLSRWSVSDYHPTYDEMLFIVHQVPLPVCGDGNVDPGEVCDEGAGNGSDACCTPACEPADQDGDGTCDREDPCPGDAADDVDGDGVCGDTDNCPTNPNAGQQDLDDDLAGDACDAADASLAVRRVRIRASSATAPNGKIAVKGEMALGAGDAFGAGAGLALRVIDGRALDDGVAWAADECIVKSNGAGRCLSADRRRKLRFGQPRGAPTTVRFAAALAGRDIGPLLGTALTLTVASEPGAIVTGIDRTGMIEACVVAGGAMRCRAP
jgi:hypothetical protein